MRRGLGVLHLCVLAGSWLSACTLTSSLDELQGEAPDASGSGGSSGASSGGNGGGFPDASAGSGGVAGSSGSAGSGGSAASGATGGSAGSVAHDPPWWNDAWSERAPLVIENAASDPLPLGFEVGFEIDPAAVFGSNQSTFTVARWDAGAQTWSSRPTHAETAGGAIWIWTPLPSSLGPNDVESSLYLHAGNPNATPSDPGTVFLMYDGFSDAAGPWHAQNSPIFGSGEIVLPAYASIRSQSQYGPGHAVDFALEVQIAVSGQYDWISAGFQRQNDFDNVEPWIIWVNRSAGVIRNEVDVSAVAAQENGPTLAIAVGDRRIYGVERFATRAVHRRDNRVEDSLSWQTAYTTPLQVRFTTQSASARAAYDFIRLRRASDPPPQVGFGAAESRL